MPGGHACALPATANNSTHVRARIFAMWSLIADRSLRSRAKKPPEKGVGQGSGARGANAPSAPRVAPRAAQRPAQAKHRMPADNIGPVIAEGELIFDNLDRCDQKWAELLGAQRFVDAAIRLVVAGVYEPVSL